MTPRLIQKIQSRILQGDPQHCWPWTGATNMYGYGVFSLAPGQCKLAHRLVWMIEHGNIPAKGCVCHHCDNRLCCNIAHLFLGTHQTNMEDMLQKKRNHWASSGHLRTHDDFSYTDAEEIRRRYKRYQNGPELCRQFHISKSTLSRIVLKQTWT